MKKLIASLLLTVISIPGMADQSAGVSCTGDNVKLEGRSTYWGEDEAAQALSQTLFTLSRPDASEGNSYTALFLAVEVDIEKGGSLIYRGTNEAGGRFEVTMAPLRSESDGNVERSVADGAITYSHGPLKGKNERVKCVFE